MYRMNRKRLAVPPLTERHLNIQGRPNFSAGKKIRTMNEVPPPATSQPFSQLSTTGRPVREPNFHDQVHSAPLQIHTPTLIDYRTEERKFNGEPSETRTPLRRQVRDQVHSAPLQIHTPPPTLIDYRTEERKFNGAPLETRTPLRRQVRDHVGDRHTRTPPALYSKYSADTVAVLDARDDDLKSLPLMTVSNEQQEFVKPHEHVGARQESFHCEGTFEPSAVHTDIGATEEVLLDDFCGVQLHDDKGETDTYSSFDACKAVLARKYDPILAAELLDGTGLNTMLDYKVFLADLNTGYCDIFALLERARRSSTSYEQDIWKAITGLAIKIDAANASVCDVVDACTRPNDSQKNEVMNSFCRANDVTSIDVGAGIVGKFVSVTAPNFKPGVDLSQSFRAAVDHVVSSGLDSDSSKSNVTNWKIVIQALFASSLLDVNRMGYLTFRSKDVKDGLLNVKGTPSDAENYRIIRDFLMAIVDTPEEAGRSRVEGLRTINATIVYALSEARRTFGATQTRNNASKKIASEYFSFVVKP